MPEGKHKSRTLRRIFVRTPGSRTTVHRRKRKPNHAKCGSCGNVLAGVPRNLPSIVKNLPKTKKRPERPFGGVLCTKCMRGLFKNKARSSE